VVEYLTDNGADVNAKDNNGFAPLHWASFNGHLEVVKHLVAKGADLNAKNSFDKTAFDLASENNRNEVANYLEEVMSGE